MLLNSQITQINFDKERSDIKDHSYWQSNQSMPKYNYEAARASFKFSSLFTRPEVIESLGRVRQECNKVIDMQLFNTQTSKGKEVTDHTVLDYIIA